MKIRMTGSSIPFSTCDSRIIWTIENRGSSTIPAPTAISSV